MKPFIKFALGNLSENPASIFVVGISGTLGLTAQKELSTLADPKRVISELTTWF